MHPVDIASRTKLPPSPELRPTAHPPLHVIENELEEDEDEDDHDDDTFLSSSPPLPLYNNRSNNQSSFRRLRSIARYASFRPQALCCSPPIAPSGSGNENLLLASSSSTTITGKKYAAQQASSLQQQQQTGDCNNDNNSTDALTSVGAICGDKGVALFRVSSPHVPLLLLRHASRPSSTTSKSTNGGGGVTSLAFQPNCPSARTSQLHLAAARGSSVLVWDASGHSLSPLVGRLGVGGHGLSFDLHGGGGSSDMSSSRYTQITSLAWQPSERTTSPWLAAATASHACLWDLREATSGSAAAAFAKPSLRFGATTAGAGANNDNSNASSPYVQLAVSGADECALLDAKGVVRIFDLRMPEQQQHGQAARRSSSSSSTTTVAGILGTFRAFHHAGIGLSCLPNGATSPSSSSGGNSNSTLWLAWGMDLPDSDAVVKIWTRSAGETNHPAAATDVGVVAPTDYWYMDGSQDASRDGSADFRLVAHCTTPNLACARVCPTADENSFVTIGQEFDSHSATSSNPTKWKAELWKLTEALQLSKIVSFSAGDDANKSITCMDKDAPGLGPLIGAELAFASIPRLVESDVDMEYTMIDKTPTRGLLLVSLTENGYVTTHSIPEAVPDIAIDENPTVAEVAYASKSSIQPRVFPDEKDWGIGDAAAAWGGASDDMISREVRSAADKSDSRTGPSAIDGGLVPFEMDFPVALPIASDNLKQMPRVDMASPSGLSVAFNDSSPDAIASTSENVRDSAAMMDDIERLRIPCPRLCGATFSPTIGGLVTFNNGAVKKMWTWYSSSTRTTEAGAAGPAAKLLGGDDAMFPDTKSVKRDIPRTLQDLIEMTKAAKEAQWGDQDSDASSAGTHRREENFFEDVSDEETSDSDGEVDELTDGPGVKLPKSNMYDQYFGEFRRPLTRPRSSSTESTSIGSKEQAVAKANSGENLAGPSSDMLSPEVRVARAFDRISLNNQSQVLACQLDLGRWTEVIDVMGESSDLDESYHQPASPRPKKQALELSSRNRFAPQSPTRNNPIQHATSDPLLVARTPQRLRQQSEGVGATVTANLSPYRYAGDERGVRGGEYGVRPNVQESMVFLRKLFTHQQEGGGGYAGLISPPDGPLLPSSLTPPGKRHVNPAVSSRTTAKSNPGPSLPQSGVYTICADGLSSRSSVRDRLVETRAICLRNAAVCEKLNEQEKADMWELLSQVVDGRLIELGGGNDKWRPRRGNALGTNLVSNILRCYESLGDVQMLSTIVCVLRSKLQDSNRSKICHSDYSLLPAGDDEKYDAWLRIYSDLLYGWGLLSIRAELNKHLVRVIRSSESAAQSTIPKAMDEGRTPGIALVFTCPTCGEDTDIGTNYCRSCHDFAFRCIICDQAVRGLLSVCDKENCRHGGHPSCLKEWFSLHKECPSGCGCNCTLLTPAVLSAPEPVVNEFI